MATQERLYRYQIYTLVDITNTEITQLTPGKEKERNQQRNFETVLQVLGLRTQLFDIGRVFRFDDTNLGMFDFGSYYLSDVGFKYKVWSFNWAVEFKNVYQNDNGRLGSLDTDFDMVPALYGLDENIPHPPHNLFYTTGKFKNVYFTEEVVA